MYAPEFDKKKGRRAHHPKRCDYHNKDKEYSPKSLNDKNHQASSYKFRQQNSAVMEFKLFLSTIKNLQEIKYILHFLKTINTRYLIPLFML